MANGVQEEVLESAPKEGEKKQIKIWAQEHSSFPVCLVKFHFENFWTGNWKTLTHVQVN